MFLDDHVINIGNELVPGIIETLNEAKDKGLLTIILTNEQPIALKKRLINFLILV